MIYNYIDNACLSNVNIIWNYQMLISYGIIKGHCPWFPGQQSILKNSVLQCFLQGGRVTLHDRGACLSNSFTSYSKMAEHKVRDVGKCHILSTTPSDKEPQSQDPGKRITCYPLPKRIKLLYKLVPGCTNTLPVCLVVA